MRRCLLRAFGGGAHHSHKPVPEGSWHRHSDDEDPYYFYNKYGPFHSYTHMNHCRPGDPHNIPEDDPYRNEIQGYIRMAEVQDTRRNGGRGIIEFYYLFGFFLLMLSIIPKRFFIENDHADKKIGDALLTAQEIEAFIAKAKQI